MKFIVMGRLAAPARKGAGLLCLSLSLGLCLPTGMNRSTSAEDWPQWMGKDRDNIWKETGIVDKFPSDGLKVLWRTEIDGGYAGPAVADGRVFITDYVTADDVQVANFERQTFTGVERVLCLDEKSGDILWKHEYPVNYSVSYPAGPRCTPTVEENRVYTLGTEGHLFCFDANSGKVLWQKNLTEDYRTKTALWGYAAHPLIDGDKLICVVGGDGSHTVAFNKMTGEEIWRTLTANEQGYSPSKIIEAGGVRQLIVTRPDGVSGVDPETGKVYWSVPYEATNGSIIMTPIQIGEYLFVAGYSNKNLLLKLAADKPQAEVVWQDENRKAVSPVNVQPIADGNTIYGYDQRGALMAVDIPSGDRLWESTEALGGERPSGTDTAFIYRHGDRYLLFTEKGDLVLAKMTRDGYQQLDQTHVIEPTGLAFGRPVVWSAPAFANRTMFVRNDKEIVAISLAAE